MPEERFFIGPPNSGLQRNVKSWLIADDAYERLNNAYVWRGTLKKRFGSQLLVDGNQTASRLRYNVGTTAAVTIPTGASQLAVGQMFSIGTNVFYIYQTGAGVATYTTSGTLSITIDTTVDPNTVTVAGGAGETVYWYPARPVMGLITFDTENINDEFPIAFDTTYAYKRASSAWERLDTETVAGDSIWTGTNADFFWGANYRGATADLNLLFVTNFIEADGIRHYDDTTETWTKADFKYSATATDQDIVTARIIVYFKDRLLLLNTKEEVSSSTQDFHNRCRFSQNGSPFEADAWYQAPGAYGKGGFIDAPTSESIITAQFLKDRLIVFFERSTYEIVYTGNRIQPFIWQKINTELGAESTFSQVPFDNVVLGVGNVGIHACDGASVQRIDDKIPQEVFQVRNASSGLERVAGIRDYQVELVYWSFPSVGDQEFPDRILVYNYETGSWAFNDDTITTFGYWQPQEVDETPRWQDIDTEWQDYHAIWGRNSQQLASRLVLGGNQQGWTFFLDAAQSTNSESLQITNFVDTTNVMTVIDHNLKDGNFVYISGMTGVTGPNGNIFKIARTDADTIVLLERTPGSDTYSGGGMISRVSKLDIWTKDFNPFNEKGFNISINKVECYVDTTANGEIMLDPVASDSEVYLSESADGTVLNPILGTSVLETKRLTDLPFPNKSRAWRSVYVSAEGESLQLRFHLSDTQMLDPDISRDGFQLNSFIIYATPTADR